VRTGHGLLEARAHTACTGGAFPSIDLHGVGVMASVPLSRHRRRYLLPSSDRALLDVPVRGPVGLMAGPRRPK